MVEEKAMLKINIPFYSVAQFCRQDNLNTIGNDEGQHTKAKGAQEAVAYVLYSINRNKP